jgi:hypothetical protein
VKREPSRAPVTNLRSFIVTFAADQCVPQYDDYTGVIPAEQHKVITKKSHTTHHIERFNKTRWQCVSCPLRSTLACSKALAHHTGAITYCISAYNPTSVAAFLGSHYQTDRGDYERSKG